MVQNLNINQFTTTLPVTPLPRTAISKLGQVLILTRFLFPSLCHYLSVVLKLQCFNWLRTLINTSTYFLNVQFFGAANLRYPFSLVAFELNVIWTAELRRNDRYLGYSMPNS